MKIKFTYFSRDKLHTGWSKLLDEFGQLPPAVAGQYIMNLKYAMYNVLQDGLAISQSPKVVECNENVPPDFQESGSKGPYFVELKEEFEDKVLRYRCYFMLVPLDNDILFAVYKVEWC